MCSTSMDGRFLKRINTWNMINNREVPMDLIVNILSRLPVNILMRLVAVCKLWYSLIYHPYFIKAHMKRSKEKPCYLMRPNNKTLDVRGTPKIYPVLLYRENEVVPLFQLNDMGGGQYSITDSCNGLVCLTDFYNLLPICIYNPATREYTILPHPGPLRILDLAITYDPQNNVYKVFLLLPNNYADIHISRYEVFTLGSDQSWRQKGYVPYYVNDSKHIQADGAIHWLYGVHKHFHYLLSIDISTEESKIHLLPDSKNSDTFRPFLIELNEKLGLCLINRFKMKIYVLNGETSSWSIKFNISLPQWMSKSAHVKTWVCPTSMRNGELLITRGRSTLVLFHVETQMSRRIDATIMSPWSEFHAIDYIETLVPCKFRWNSARWPEIMEILDDIYPDYKQQRWRIDLNLKL